MKININNLSKIGVFTLVLSLIFKTSAYANTSNWMSQIDDNKQLNQITMPGSHDAGMSETNNCNPFVGAARVSQTQNLNILDQARAGSRYYDIRVDYDQGFWDSNAYLITYHRTGRMGCGGQHLDTVLDQAIMFLQQNPSETIILKFSHTRDFDDHKPADITQRVITLLNNKYSNFLFKSIDQNLNIAQLPLQTVRGKIIAVFDDEYQSYIDSRKGFFRYFDGINNYGGITVYDNYSNTYDYSTMRNDQLNKLANFGGFYKPYLFLLSWTLTSNGFYSIEGLAEEANGNLPYELQYMYGNIQKPNIIYLDYINSDIAEKIIQLNFK